MTAKGNVVAANGIAAIHNRNGLADYFPFAAIVVGRFSQRLAAVIHNIDGGDEGGIHQRFGNRLDLLEIISKHCFQNGAVGELHHGRCLAIEFVLQVAGGNAVVNKNYQQRNGCHYQKQEGH